MTRYCKIAGVIFVAEDSAYSTIKEYLNTIKELYESQAGGGEIIADIESRIAELILEQQPNSKIIELPLAESIIAQMGGAEEFDDEPNAADENDDKVPPQEPTPSEPKVAKRLYRDVESGVVAGVCSGFARYLSKDAVLVRIIAIFLLFAFGFSFWIYIIMWIITPAARTPRQRAELRGEAMPPNSPSGDVVADQSRSLLKIIVIALAVLLLTPLIIFVLFLLITFLITFTGMVIHI